MSDDRRAKKADRFLQESESAHDDALRNLQGDVRLAEKFDELEKQSDKKRGDPFFYTLRRKRTDASALKTEDPLDRTTKQGLGPEPVTAEAPPSSPASPEAVATVDAASEPAPPAAPSAEPAPQRAAPRTTKGRSGLLVFFVLVLLGGLAVAFALTRGPATPERTMTSAEILTPSVRAGTGPTTIATTSLPTTPASQSTPAPSETASVVAPPVKSTPPTNSAVAPTTSTPPIKTSTPVGNPPVY